MSRTDRFPNYNNESIIEKPIINEPKLYNNSPKTLLIDMDSIIYTALYKSEEDIEECKYKINNKIQEITLNIEKWFNIVKTFLFIKGENNFRYKLYPKYKANRPKKHPFIDILYKYCEETFDNIITCHGAEADDYVYSAHIANNYESILAIIDKDLLQVKGQFYLYNTTDIKKGEFVYIDEEKANYNLAVQCLIGDAGDNVNMSPGIGIKYAKKHLKEGMSLFSYIKQIYIAYLKAWNNDINKAKEMIKLTYNLLKLKNMNNE